MPNEVAKPTVLIVGTYKASDAYPNVKYKVNAIKKDTDFQCIECRYSSDITINYRSSILTIFSILKISARFSLSVLTCLRHIVVNRHVDSVYIPYPATHILLGISFLPRYIRPDNIVADVFISLYDTIVLDRKLIRGTSFFAKLLIRVERRAMMAANILSTDTPESALHFSCLLGIREDKFTPIPLSTNEIEFKPHYKPLRYDRPLSVIFIGTLVPLHGLDTIINALSFVELSTTMNMTFVGSGQESEKLSIFLSSSERIAAKINYRWIKKWQSSEQLQALIADSDLCLGIMKNTGKSARVWPYKNYLYMACQKAVVTATTPVSTRLRLQHDGPMPFISVDASSHTELAQCLTFYARHKRKLPQIAESGRILYEKQLSNNYAYSQLKLCLSSRTSESNHL